MGSLKQILAFDLNVLITFQLEERSSHLVRKQLRKESLKKNLSLNGIRTHDLCDAGAVLYQLRYQLNQLGTGELVSNFK